MKKIKKLTSLFLVISFLFTVFSLGVPAYASGVQSSKLQAGGGASLLVSADGTVWAWGHNGYGQLGDGTYDDKYNPIKVHKLSGVKAVAAGQGRHLLALKDDGTVWSWGYGYYGQLGNGSSGPYAYFNTPAEVSNLNNIKDIAVGVYHSLALENNGMVWAWGRNDYGQLGDGSLANKLFPQRSNLDRIVAVAAGEYHSLALTFAGTVLAWGNNQYGQLGIGTNIDSRVPVVVMDGVIAIASGGSNSLALKSDGTVWAWGRNYWGALGNGSYDDSNIPVKVKDLSGVIAIAGTTTNSLALKSDGTVWAWGYGGYDGQLGNGITNETIPNYRSNVPVKVSNLSSVTAIALAGEYSLAMKNDGTLWSWGRNTYGQLGNGSNISSSIPVLVDFSI